MSNNKTNYEQLESEVQRLQAKLDAIDKSNQRKSKFQLWLGRVGFGLLLGSGLKSSMQQLYQELPNKVQKKTLANVTTEFIWRFTRIGLFGILIALIPTVLLWQQNQKIDEQTKLFEKQNQKIDNQIQLEESNRRGALIVMMSNIMDKVDEELKERERQDSSRALSNQLIARIAALSYSFRPYRFLQDSNLIEEPISPERGQLLLALVNSDLEPLSYRNIYRESSFESSYLKNANLEYANLDYANLRNANLRNANLKNANLKNADLYSANLIGAKLRNADLYNASLISTNLSGADLTSASFRYATLNRANLTHASLSSADFSSSSMISAKMQNVRAYNTNFYDVFLREANMEEADLKNVDLRYADLREINFKNVDLNTSNLENARIATKDWLNELIKQEVINQEDISKKWMVDTVLEKRAGRGEYYRIKPKPKS